ncbi:MAG TPA: GntR family transcriptional regulator [Burkholderiales bacterium]|nr:GntR family transcriptional regulator [Burkholderiales bacterium]
MSHDRSASLAGSVYAAVRNDLYDFRLGPGQRFSENELAARLGVSRTPVREALYRLRDEGYIDVASKSGWTVRPFEFETFEHLYEVRAVLEISALKRLCEMVPAPPLDELKEVWLVPHTERVADGREVGRLDEAFHQTLVIAAGNPELARIHRDITDRIRLVRRLEFTVPDRIAKTYAEHAQILRAILRRKLDQATMLLRTHIELARGEVRKITLHKFAVAREAAPVPSARLARAR